MTDVVDAPSTRSWPGPALEVMALWGLAGAQPILELFGKNAEFFLAAGTGPIEIVAFSVIVAFAVPLVLVLVELGVWRLHPRAGSLLHRGVVGFLGALLGLNVARQFGLDALLVAAAVGAAFAALALWLQRRSTARSAMHYLALAPLAFVLLFLFASDAGSLVFSEDAEVVDVDGGTDGPVAVLVFDELPLASLLTREGAINERRFPNFARLADTANWYRNATAVAPSTPESVPTILTGRFPEDGLLPTSADHPINLFTLLGGTYDVDAFEGVTDLCPEAVCLAEEDAPGVGSFVDDVTSAVRDAGVVYGHLTLPGSLRDRLPTLGQAWAGFLDEPEAVDRPPSPQDLVTVDPDDDRDEVTDFLTGRAEAARARGGQGRDLVPLIAGFEAGDGSLLVGHDPFMPHRPWHITPSGTAYDPEVGGVVGGQETWPESPAFVRRVLQRHLLQVGFADTLLGLLLDRFEEAGTLDDATIVVTADHGMGFGLGGRARAPREDNVHEIYRVPLLVKEPGQTAGEGRVSDQNAMLIDVLPTVLDLNEIDAPADAEFDGLSLVDPDFARDDAKPVVYVAGPEAVPGDFAEVLPLARRNAGYVGDRGWLDLLQVGAAGRFVNHPVTSLPRRSPLEGTWSMDQEDQLREVADGPFRPLAVAGRLELAGGVTLPNQVLVAVDGVIAGVGDLDPRDGRFAALLDERRVGVGAHDIDLYLPTPTGGVRLIEGD